MTDIILNQLYPGGVMKQLGDAAGGVVYNQYAAGGCVGQLYTAAGADVVLDQYAAGGPLHQIELEIEGGGGGSGLDWVPADAVIHIDLVRAFNDEDAAWTEAGGIVAVDTLLGSDPNTQNGWGTTQYDPGDLAADGLLTLHDVAIVGAARTKLIAGSTFVYRFKTTASTPGSATFIEYLSADGNAGLEINTHDATAGSVGNVNTWNGDATITTGADVNSGSSVTNVVAITLTPTRVDMAVNGGDAVTTALTTDDFPVSGGSPLVAVLVEITGSGEGGYYWQSLTIYDALPSTTGLSELSEAS